jgi:hypothetical protein
LTIFLIAVSGCGGRKTVASKSAEAYRDALQKGTPIAAGGHGDHEHGASVGGDPSTQPMSAADHAAMGHGTTTQDHAAMGHGTTTQDHAAMGHGMKTQDHAAMGHGTTTQDHAAMGHGTTTQDHAAMGHGTTPQDHAAMGHGTTTQDHAAMGHGTTPQDHAAMGHATTTQDHAAMGHGATPAQDGAHEGHDAASVIPRGGLWGPVPGALLNPATPDIPAPIAVEEASKAVGPTSTTPTHEGHQ